MDLGEWFKNLLPEVDLREQARDLLVRLVTFVRWFLSVAIDTAALVVWVHLQSLAHTLGDPVGLSEIDKAVFLVFQVLFAIATLAPVVVYIYVDIYKIILQAQDILDMEKTKRRRR